MFDSQLSLMLYVENVPAEREFWEAAGFDIVSEAQIMGYPSFKMRSNPESSLIFTVYDRSFSQQFTSAISLPSIVLESRQIEQLHNRMSMLTYTCSALQTEPYKTFEFYSPSGYCFSVQESF